jgi:CheY-like chemotaxis protein
MRRLAQSNEALAQTHAALVRLQNLREEFVASVGHELRTPMNAILGFNNVLWGRVDQDPMVSATIEHIHDATHQLLDLVNDILDFSQLQAEKMQAYPVPCDVVHALQKTCTDWEEKARIKGIEFRFQVSGNIPECILLDVEKFLKVAHKLLDNAFKFTTSGSVQVRLSLDGKLFKLEVEDTGHGISPAVQRQIFRRFERADMETNRKYGGAGLGLAICEGLLQLMDGRIEFSSQEGQGATFCVLLPLIELTPQSKPLPSPYGVVREPPGGECRVLLVDDNKINLLVAKAQLNKLWPDMRVVCCQSADMALDVLKSTRFDLALFDVMMPDIDGLELTRRLRDHPDPSIAKMPIVAFTAHVGSDEHARCLRAGVDGVLTKPLDEKTMREVMTRIIWPATPESAHVH